MIDLKYPGIEIQADEETAIGKYCNLSIIAFSHSEIIVDFGVRLAGFDKAKLQSRIVLTPDHAKRLLLNLQENISRYEKLNGVIEVQTKPIVDPFGHKGNA